MIRKFILAEDISGFFSFLNPIINALQDLDHFGLIIYTLFEVLLIIPPIEVIYYPLILLNMDTWYLYLINVSVMNVVASAIGYFVGMKVGLPVLQYLTSENIVKKTHKLFEKYGVLVVAIGAFTPIPYTIVVFFGGIAKMDFKKFILAGFLGRVPRYLIGGYVLVYVLKEFNSEVLNQYTLIVSIVGMLLFILYYILRGIYKVYKRSVN